MKKFIMVEQMFKRLLYYLFVTVSKITNRISVNTISNTNFVQLHAKFRAVLSSKHKTSCFPPLIPSAPVNKDILFMYG